MRHAKALVLFATLVLGASPALAQSPLREAWKEPLGPARNADLQVCVSVGPRVLVLDVAGGVTALDPATGNLQWFVQMPGSVSMLPSDGGAIALASGTTIIVVDGPSGRRLFETTSAMAPATSPCSDGRVLFVPALLDDTLVAWDMRGGGIAWEFHMPAPHAGPALLCGPEGSRSVLLPGEDGVLRAIPAQLDVPRTERWSQRLGLVVGVPLVVGPTVIVGTLDRAVVALDAGSGVVKWRRRTGEAPRTSPVAVGKGFAIGTTGKLLMLSQETGEILWEQPSTDRPLGDVAGGMLVRHGAGGCGLLDASTGRTLAEHLPGSSIAVAGWLIELRGGTDVAGWKPNR